MKVQYLEIVTKDVDAVCAAYAALKIPRHGTFAIYFLGGNQHGLWQL